MELDLYLLLSSLKQENIKLSDSENKLVSRVKLSNFNDLIKL